ncbi:MAG: Ig-like domain-containing protein [Clostridia bacterium]|nr:Ig-like domain-containing protein [Clostridia bacterium]
MVTKRLFALGLVCALLVCCAQAANGYTLKLSSSSIRLAPGESRSITWTVEPVNLVSHTVTWSSENSYIASVDQKGRITAHAAGTTYVVAELETGAQRRVTVTVTGQPVTRLKLDQSRVDLELGEKAKLSYTINENADDKRVRWSVDDTSVATVDQNGVVTAVGGGIATVTLLCVNGMTDSCLIYVPSEVMRIELHPSEAYLGIGASRELDAYVFPGNARGRELRWESRDPAIAQVDQDGNVIGLSSGDVSIRAMSANGIYALCLLHVRLLPDKLYIEQESAVLSRENRCLQLTVRGEPAGSEAALLSWESSDPAVVTVENGLLTAQGYGQATVSVQAQNGVSASIPVAVSEPPTGVRFAQSAYTLPVGGEGVELVPVFTPSGSAVVQLVFSSSDESVARVDEKGLLTPVGYGVCSVTLNCAGGLSCSAEVRVYQDIRSLSASQSSFFLKQYELAPIQFYSESGQPYLGEPAAVSDDEDVCLYLDGYLYARSPGRARVTFSNPGTSITCQVSVTVSEPAGFARCVALTFDNGPGEHTREILEVLEAYNLRASFFLLGQSLQSHPDEAALLAGTGHEIGNHTWDNSSVSSSGIAATAEAIEQTDKLTERLLGVTPTVLRAPDALLPRALFNSFFDSRRFVGRGHEMPDENANVSAQELYSLALESVYHTSVLTFHDGAQTAAALRLLIPELLKRGYRFLTVSELIEYTGSKQEVFSTLP